MKRWFYFLFLLVLILSARSAALAETSTVSINNVFFSNLEHPDGKAIYHTGQNNVTAELRHFGTDEIPVLLAFTVEDTGTGKLLSVGAKQITAKGNYPITCTVSCTVPNDTAIANTRAKLLALHARTLQPLDDLISIAPDASYPFADTTAKTQLVSSFSGTIVSAENGVIVLSPNESIRNTETIDIPAPAALVEDAQTRIGAACNVLADILPTGEKKAARLASKTLALQAGNILNLSQQQMQYRDPATRETKTVVFNQTFEIYYDGTAALETNLYDWLHYIDQMPDAYLEFSAFSDRTDANGFPIYDLLHIRRPQQAIVTAVNGDTISTLNHGTLNLNGAILQYKDGSFASAADILPDDVLVIERIPGDNQKIIHATVLPQSFIEGTVVEINNISYNPTCRIESLDYPYETKGYTYIPAVASSCNMGFFNVGCRSVFYLGAHGEIFSKIGRATHVTYVSSVKARWADDNTGLSSVTLSLTTGSLHLSNGDTISVINKDGEFMPCTLDTPLSRADFSGTPWFELFSGQEQLTLGDFLCTMTPLPDTATPEETCIPEPYKFTRISPAIQTPSPQL